MEHPKQELGEKVYKGRTLDIVHRRISPDHIHEVEYEFVQRPEVVVLIPFLSSSEVIMIRQYRAPVDKYIWEFPGGTVEAGEDPKVAAQRELEEETGYKSEDLELIRIFYTSPHFSDEQVYLFVAKELSPGKQGLQEREFLSVYKADSDALWQKYKFDEIVDAKTIIAYNYLLDHGWGPVS